jgi:hypothetical protein
MTALALIATILQGVVVTGELLLLAVVTASLVVAYHASPLAGRPTGRGPSRWLVWLFWLGALGVVVLVATFALLVPGTIGWPGWLSLLSQTLAAGAGLCLGEWIARRRGLAHCRRPPGVTVPHLPPSPPPAAGHHPDRRRFLP